MSFFGKKDSKKIADMMIKYRKVFSSDDGKEVLKDLMKVAHVLDCTYYSGDPHETAYREGERSIVLRILKTINTDPEQVLKMLEQDNQGV